MKHYTSPPARQFVGRMVQHILPKGFQRIRYYGLHGNERPVQAILDHLKPANLFQLALTHYWEQGC